MSDQSPTTDEESPSTDNVETQSHTSTNWKVLGEISDTDGTGVLGHATSESGTTTGAWGVVDSPDAGAAGVRGETTAGSGETYGVHGKSPSPGGKGVLGQSMSDATNFTDFAEGYGVYGISDRQHGVVGYKPSDVGGDGAAVYGRSDTPSPALYGFNLGAGPAVEAVGYVNIAEIGCEAYLSTNQRISSSVWTRVAFDAESVDDFTGFDTGTGQYTVQAPGDYHVCTNLEWLSRLSGGTSHDVAIRLNGDDIAKRVQEVQGAGSESSFVHDHLGKTLYGLSSGDTIGVWVFQDSAYSRDIQYGREHSYVTIDKVG